MTLLRFKSYGGQAWRGSMDRVIEVREAEFVLPGGRGRGREGGRGREREHTAGVWRVGRRLDARIEGQKELVAPANQPIVPPSEEKLYPALDSLRWREKHLNARC